MKERPHSKDLRKGRISLQGHAYFITKCVHQAVKNEPLARPDVADMVISSLIWAKEQGWWRILGFAVMPDHYHVIVGQHSTKGLSDVMESIDKYTARRISQLLRRTGPFWQDGFYEHAIRDRKDYDDILEYVHSNPVEAGLVISADSWAYSTANQHYADEIDWEWVGPAMPDIRSCKYRFSRDSIPSGYR